MSNAYLFHAVARLEDAMIRASMPRTSAADPKPIAARRTPARVWSNGRVVTAIAPLTFTLAEAAHVT